MLSFLIVISIASIVGMQMGVVAVLKNKGIASNRAISYSFILYLMPFILFLAHYKLYRERYSLLEKSKKDLKLSEKQYAYLKKQINSRYFKFIVIGGGILDILTPKDNILILVKFAVEYDRKMVRKHIISKESLIDKIGMIGIFKKTFNSISDLMKDHAEYETILKRYAH